MFACLASRELPAPPAADPMARLSMEEFINGCIQVRRTLIKVSTKVVQEWDSEALKNAFGWADYIEAVTSAWWAPWVVRLPAHTECSASQVIGCLQPIDFDAVDSQIRKMDATEGSAVFRPPEPLTLEVLRQARKLMLRTLLLNRCSTARCGPSCIRTCSSTGVTQWSDQPCWPRQPQHRSTAASQPLRAPCGSAGSPPR